MAFVTEPSVLNHGPSFVDRLSASGAKILSIMWTGFARAQQKRADRIIAQVNQGYTYW